MIAGLGRLIVDAAEKFGDKSALIAGSRTFSYRELDKLSNRLASTLGASGLASGDRVTLYGENSWEWVVAYFGILKCGAVVNPINMMLTPKEVEYVVGDCDARVIIASKEKGLPLLGIREKSGVETLLLYGDDIPDGAESFDVWLGRGKDSYQTAPVDINELSTICYTSGTTGNPKGAMLSHRAVTTNVVMTALMHGRTGDDVVVTALPCPHVYGNVVMNSTFYKGGTLILHSRFDADHVFSSINRYRATVFDGVPTMYMYMLDHPDLNAVDFSALRLCTVGGQTMPVSKMEAWEAVAACPLIELWGMTEIGGLGTTFVHDGEYRRGSIGVPLPYVRAKIVDVKDATLTLPANEVGELMIAGPIVMQGYYGNPAATQEALSEDGYVRTGDLAEMDSDGCIYIVDRIKDLIITAGYNIYPAELERVIASHPDVAMVAVGPVAHENKGEVAKAYIVPGKGTSPEADSIIDYCRQHLAAYKVPRAIQFVTDLPKTSSGKIMRRELHKLDNR